VPADAYGAAVRAADPDLYWRLDETSGTTANDISPNEVSGTYRGGVTLGTAGALAGVPGTGVTFDGASGLLSSDRAFVNPTTYSEELWFSTTTGNGGKLIGFGRANEGLSSSYDRHVYLEHSGQLTFGTYTGQLNTITSPLAYNDGAWHHLVATQSSAGMRLFVDGVLVGTNPQTGAESYTGYWRVGSDNTWAAQPYFDGRIDEVAVYGTALSAETVAQHYALGSGTGPANQPPVAAFASTVAGLQASLDATTSSDPDGTVASYAWAFGDGGTGSGATTSHTYVAAGTYTVSLTVTDDGGASSSISHDVTVVAPNAPPTASFTASASGLGVSVDASASTDADGTIAGYAWAFGDGSTGSGVTASHTYASAGTYPVTLTVTDDDSATTSTIRSVTVAAANQPPTAAFVSSVTGLQVQVDGASSADPDGTVASYAWTFGDGATGSGATSSRTYASAGAYTVTLTVTDNLGATASVSQDVTVTPLPAGQLVADAFGRSLATGWGSADLGGAWTLLGTASNYSVGSGVGAQRITAAGSTRSAYLNGVSSTDTDVQVTTSLDKPQTGGGTSVSLVGRRVGSGEYSVRLKVLATGVLNVAAMRTGTALSSVNLPGTYVPGSALRVRLQVAGVSPTTVRAKVWAAGAAEPAAWQVSATDSTAALQVGGGIGLTSYLSGSATNAPMTVSFDDLLATTTSVAPPINQAPVAAFTSSASGLTAQVDGSGSSDPDGSVVGYAWSFGDGTTGSGATASRTFLAAGAYTVTLTVTDNSGATASVSQPVTVSAPPPAGQLAADAFGRTAPTGWGIADVGGAWTLLGAASSYGVDGSVGIQRITTAGATRSAYLNGVSSTSSEVAVTTTVDKEQTGGGTYVTVVGRRVGPAEYGVRLRFLATGVINLATMQTGTALSSVNLPGAYTPGTQLRVRLQVFGTSPTTVRAKVWAVGAPEPAAWQVSANDSTATLQVGGGVGLASYLSGSATNAPMTVSFDELVATEPVAP